MSYVPPTPLILAICLVTAHRHRRGRGNGRPPNHRRLVGKIAVGSFFVLFVNTVSAIRGLFAGRGVESTTGAVAVGGGGSCSRRLFADAGASLLAPDNDVHPTSRRPTRIRTQLHPCVDSSSAEGMPLSPTGTPPSHITPLRSRRRAPTRA